MSTYVFRCGSCRDEVDYEFSMGKAPRILVCDDCGGIAQLVIGAGVQIGPLTAEARTEQQKYDRDADAYKRMRDRGLQPDHIAGSHKMENEVGDQFDVTYKHRLQPAAPKEPWQSIRERVRDGMEAAKQDA
jgi:hypothetical protein